VIEISKPETFIGVDPGLTGAIVALNREGQLLWWERMPIHHSKRVDARALFKLFLGGSVRVGVEKVAAIGRGSRASMFTFGGVYYAVLAAIEIAEAPLLLVPPKTWQAVHLKGHRTTDPKNTKDASRSVASDRWPGLREVLAVKSNHDVADAALIAEFTRRSWLMDPTTEVPSS